MNTPDPRHAAATVPASAPPGPQWGGQAPSVIDPNLIAHMANSFFNAGPGQTIDPQALANFAIGLDRPPPPPSSVPGAIGAAAAAPGTSVVGAPAAPFMTELPGFPSSMPQIPTQSIPAKQATGLPAAPEAAQTPHFGSSNILPEMNLRALAEKLGQAVSLTRVAPPPDTSGFTHPDTPGTSPDTLYFLSDHAAAHAPAHGARHGQAASTPPAAPASASESLYFINETQPASVPGAPRPAPMALPSNEAVDYPSFPIISPVLQPIYLPELESGTRIFNPHAIKRDFPILNQKVHGKPLVWLDNAATTQKPQAVIDRLAHFYETENSNIHRAAHTLAARATDAYEAAREKVRRFLGAGSPNDIVFVRGATEAINLVAQAWGRRNIHEGDEIVVTHLEHHANIVPWQMLCAETGARLRVAPVDNSGQVLLDEYTKLLGPRTRLVSFTQVSNALGTITPAQEMTAIAHRHGACVLVDGAQSVSHMPVNVQALDCDFFVFSGHKVFAPTGIGVLYGKPDVLAGMPPWQGGGNMIADVTFEKTIYQAPPGRFEAGTGNIADAVGLGAAIDYLDKIGMINVANYEHELLAYGTEKLCSVPGLSIIGTAKEKAGVLSFVLDGCRSEDVGKALDQEGIAVRSGHHCAQPILRRFGLESTVRPSLALYNSFEDIDALCAALRKIKIQQNYRLR